MFLLWTNDPKSLQGVSEVYSQETIIPDFSEQRQGLSLGFETSFLPFPLRLKERNVLIKWKL